MAADVFYLCRVFPSTTPNRSHHLPKRPTHLPPNNTSHQFADADRSPMVKITASTGSAKTRRNATTTTRSPVVKTDNGAFTRPPLRPSRAKEIADPNSLDRPSYSSSFSSSSSSSSLSSDSYSSGGRILPELKETSPMTRSFRVSFQSEFFYFQTCRVNATPPHFKHLRERERKTDDGDGRRPVSSRSVKKFSLLTRSLDFSTDSKQEKGMIEVVRPPAVPAPSLINFAAEMRRGKKRESTIEEAHLLRLLNNRHLQLRFINARSKTAAIDLGKSTEVKIP